MTTELMAEMKMDVAMVERRRNSFNADDYAIGILLSLSPDLEHVRIIHPEKGVLLLSPKRGEYIALVSDMAGFLQAPKASFTVTEVKEKFPTAGVSRRMEDLLWEAALGASQGRLVNGLRKYDVVQFTRWPDLTRVSLTPNAMRICALLTRFPSGITLSCRILKIDEAEMYSVCSAAKILGIVNMLYSNKGPDSTDETVVAEHERGVSESKSGRFFGRLLAKLSGI